MTFIPALSVLTSVYKGKDYLEDFLQNLRAQTLFPELEIVLVLNDASHEESRIAKDLGEEFAQQVQVIHVEKVETLGASWNRAWVAARAPYLAIWNIDDRRFPDSLGNQLAAMEQNPDWMLCYGDYIRVSEYSSETGRLRQTPAYKASHFSRAFAQGGAFWVIRRNAAEQIGYFDEQFEVGPDMDFSLRMATAGLWMGRCAGVLGYFTDAGQGLSTRDGARRSAIERTAIQMRYGVFDKVQGQFVKDARKFRLDAIKAFGDWHLMSEYLTDYKTYLQHRQPLRVLGWLRNFLRAILEALGLLRPIYRLQEKFWQREI